MNKVKITICGIDYVIAGNEDEEYVLNLARKLDAELKKIMAQNPRISVMTAAVLAALDHLDESVKAQESTDNMRLQIKDYLDDAAKASIECEEQKREIERLKREIASLKTRLDIQ